jgi:tRNA-specific 2-thiouridylase
MSGGVDSSVAAALLVRQERGCCKIGIARFVAQKLAIPYEVIDRRDHFRRNVIDDFLRGYLDGSTPNPCVRCNERVKLAELIALADERGIEYIATGHYARIAKDGSDYEFLKSIDQKKDQSYFLYRINPSWLSRLLFPVGGMEKGDVWKEAETLGLPADELKESQEICFVSQGDYRSFLEKEMPHAKAPGRFIDQDGRDLGAHEGIAFYTPGQRRGLGIATGQRLYVQRVQPSSNTVVLATEDGLLQQTCTVADLNLFDPSLLQKGAEVDVKIRYATPATPAAIESIHKGAISLRFRHSQRALSPGQSAVFYRGERVLGGGIIQPS